MHAIPTAFIDKMKTLLGEDFSAFDQHYAQTPSKGLRINTNKIGINEFLELSPFTLEPIPWVKEGFYYDVPDRPGKHPYHAAGLYYIQEPSAMAVTDILDPQPGETILDLAAAPGGKSTHSAIRMQNTGLLIANEIHPNRAKILSENIERLGITNSLVTNEPSQKLAQRFPEFFDRIILDAPCSGEGMFRKDEQACQEWSEKQVYVCANRQTDILEHAAIMLKPGGRLVYSTCTFSPEENEQVIASFIERHPDWSLLPIEQRDGFCPGNSDWTETKRPDLSNTVRLWPHLLKGEGHYVALLQKNGEVYNTINVPSQRKSKKDKILTEVLSLFYQFSKENLQNVEALLTNKEWKLFGSHLYILPTRDLNLAHIKVLRAGLHLGEFKKNRFEPSHALALALHQDQFMIRLSYEPDDEAVKAYLRGEAIPINTQIKGWTGICVNGFPLGWGKASNGMLKNHYPKGLRMLS